MRNIYEFQSDRLGFRRWKDSDAKVFIEMNSNKNVMKYFPNMLSESETLNFIIRINQQFDKYGYGLWAVELKQTNEFIGFIGFSIPSFKLHFTPCIEIGWRLDEKHWNNGYAAEGAKRCLEYGFNNLDLKTILSFTSKINTPSINVMKKIGMKQIDTFMHPNIDENCALCEHVLYRITK